MGEAWKSPALLSKVSGARLLELHERDGLTYEVIGRRFGRSESSVRRAIIKHRRLLSEARA